MAASELEDLLKDARGEGTLQSAGTFTIDFATAISKMRAFQVENQYQYVNRLVRAAVLSGAPRVTITASSSKTRVHFSTCAFAPNQLEGLFEQILQQSRPAIREMAVATNLSLALRPAKVELSVNDGTSARLLYLTGKLEGDAFLPRAEIHRDLETPLGTTFQLTRSAGATVANWGTQSPEYLNVLRSFRFSPIPIEINGSVIDRTAFWGAPASQSWFSSEMPTISVRPSTLSFARSVPQKHHTCEIRVKHSQEGLNGLGLCESRASSILRMGAQGLQSYPESCYLVLGLQVDPSSPSTARFVYAGETLQTFPVRLGLGGMELLLSAHGLNLDAAGEKVSEDDVFKIRWEEAKSYVKMLEMALHSVYSGVTTRSLAAQAIFDQKERWKSQFLDNYSGYVSGLNSASS